MKETEKLKAWAETEKAKGLFDIKFFPGTDRQVSIEEAARVAREALESDDYIDITNEPL